MKNIVFKIGMILLLIGLSVYSTVVSIKLNDKSDLIVEKEKKIDELQNVVDNSILISDIMSKLNENYLFVIYYGDDLEFEIPIRYIENVSLNDKNELNILVKENSGWELAPKLRHVNIITWYSYGIKYQN